MKLNVSKCKVFCIKGETKVTLNGWELGKSEKEKELGIMMLKNLTWTANANHRCEKALKAFFIIKRNVLRGTAWQAKKNLYLSYIVPIISYGCSLETKQTGSEKSWSNPDESYEMDLIHRTTDIQRQTAQTRYPFSIALSRAPRAIVIPGHCQWQIRHWMAKFHTGHRTTWPEHKNARYKTFQDQKSLETETGERFLN